MTTEALPAWRVWVVDHCSDYGAWPSWYRAMTWQEALEEAEGWQGTPVSIEDEDGQVIWEAG